jgi:hypothetical protein
VSIGVSALAKLGATRSAVLVVGSGARGSDEPPKISNVRSVSGRSSWWEVIVQWPFVMVGGLSSASRVAGRWRGGDLKNGGKFSERSF